MEVRIIIFSVWSLKQLSIQAGTDTCTYSVYMYFPEVHVQARNRNQAKTGTDNPLIGQI